MTIQGAKDRIARLEDIEKKIRELKCAVTWLNFDWVGVCMFDKHHGINNWRQPFPLQEDVKDCISMFYDGQIQELEKKANRIRKQIARWK